MTVANGTYKSPQYTLSAVDETLPTVFYFLEEVSYTYPEVLSDTRGTLTEGVDYTIIFPVDPGLGGSIVMIDATIGEKITIFNNPSQTQEDDYEDGGRFPAQTVEDGLDKVHMRLNRNEGDFDDRAIQYPLIEAGNGVSNIMPIVSDRIGGGVGTLLACSGVDGGLEVLAKGTLSSSLTLSNDSTMGSPDATNGYTGLVIKTVIDGFIAGVGGLAALGVYIVKSGTNYLDGNADLNADIIDLDTAVGDNAMAIDDLDTDIIALDDRIDDLEEIDFDGANTSLESGNVSSAFANFTSFPTIPAGKSAIQLTGKVSNSSARTHRILIKDSDGREIELARNHGTSALSGADSNSMLIDVAGGTTMQWKVERIAGADDTGLSFEIINNGWI